MVDELNPEDKVIPEEVVAEEVAPEPETETDVVVEPEAEAEVEADVDAEAEADVDTEDKTEIDWKAESRKHEREAKANRAAAAELARIKEGQMSESEQHAAALQEANDRAEKAEALVEVERAARKHSITDDNDLELLANVPADQVDALAKRLAKPTLTVGKSSTEVTGAKAATSLQQQLEEAEKARDFSRTIELKQQIAATR